MSRHALLLSLTVLLLWCLCSVPRAEAWELMGGMTRADLQLAEKEAGFYLGVQVVEPLGGGPFVLIGSAEYQQLRGRQEFLYTNPRTGLFRGDGTVTLHGLQPAGFLALNLSTGRVAVRVYSGASVLLKVGESWDEPDGQKAFDLGYEDLVLQGHLGVTIVLERLLLDARYSAGLMEGVVYRDADTVDVSKAAGEDLPEDGEKTSLVQVGLGMRF